MGMKTKAGKNGEQESSYAVTDVVLAKIRGYPSWPGVIVDPDTVPPGVAKERPTNKKSTFYCVRFFPAGDYAWTVAKDISKLQKHEIEAYVNEPSKKSGDLREGYQIALDPEKWLAEKEAQAQEVAEAEANAPIDQLDSEEEGGDAKASKSKKRKRESDAAPSAKAKTKSKPKKPSEEPGNRKKGSGIAKVKKNGTKSKAMIESEDEGGPEAEDEDEGPSKKPVSPVAKKAKRDKAGDDDALEGDEEAKRVREWRHKLQKVFLTQKSAPKPDDMPQMDELFTSVEQYGNMTIQYLSFSKIGKVMRHIAALSEDKVPRNDEYDFLARAQTLVDRWHDILNHNKPKNGTDRAKTENGDGTEVDKGAMDVDVVMESTSVAPVTMTEA